ncbi:NAD-dependent epimerase/dehydratase family protein [Paenibacillus harenae]|uniref:NAD-dependent epimerase/dehydratase family protein n=1 Tax=Paenibacillus harenae TaxID=306543 RepID=UPI000414C006|nr:NAD-dependent epimerase/dehydratase family protein [Paenibacillus harenae]
MKVLVTGAAGFIGSHIVDSLISLEHKVIGIDNFTTGVIQNINKSCSFYEIDINSEKLREVFHDEKPDVVIHNAAQINVNHSIKDPIKDEEINIRGTVSILENMKNSGCSKIIYPSSAAIYGKPIYLPVDELHPIQPMSFYGISKYTPELYIKTYSELFGLDYTILRYSNVFGLRQSAHGEAGVISIFMDRLQKGLNPVIHGDGEQFRDFVYVKDVVRANIFALEKGSQSTLNICTNSKSSINHLLRQLQNNLNTNLEPKYENERKGDIKESCLDNTSAFSILGWKPEYSLESGLKDLCELQKRNRIQ